MKGTITKIEVKVIFVINFYQGFCELVVRRMATN